MRRFYEISSDVLFLDEKDRWDDECMEEDWDGCCEDPYEEEENEREWCD